MGKANLALTAAVIFLLLSGGAAYIAFSRLSMNESWVRHTRDVQSGLAKFSMTTGRAARLRAEYIDSGDNTVLEEHVEVVNQVRNTLDSIRQMTSDNAREQVDCAQLSKLTEQRILLMDQAIELKKSGKSTLAGQAAINRNIISVAEETDRLMQRMYDEETQLLNERTLRMQRTSKLTVAILVMSFILAVVLFVVHHHLLTEQVKARAQAETAQRTISAKLLTLQDEERRRFARELHDSVGQHLAALKMAVSLLLDKFPAEPTLQDCIRMLDDSISETRTISHLLHPPLLDEAGLNSASRWFVEGFAARSGIEVRLDIEDGPGRLADPIELVLFRVLQESLTNVHRHSGTTRADVTLHTEGSTVVLRVRDYGHGISGLGEDGTGGVGLAGMKERVREIGGTMEIRSSPAGTEVRARVPAQWKQQPAEPLPPAVEEVRK